MPVPKRKVSKSRRDKRQANKGITPGSFSICANCPADQGPQALAPHQACRKCGFYKGAKVLKTKADRSIVRKEKKQARAAAQSQPQAEIQEPKA